MLLRYGKSNGWLDGQPAMITRRVGRGRITYLGAVLDPDLMRRVVAWATADAQLAAEFGPVPGSKSAGASMLATVFVLINHIDKKTQIALPVPMNDILHGGDTLTSIDLDAAGRGRAGIECANIERAGSLRAAMDRTKANMTRRQFSFGLAMTMAGVPLLAPQTLLPKASPIAKSSLSARRTNTASWSSLHPPIPRLRRQIRRRPLRLPA